MAVSTIKQFTQLPHAYYVRSASNSLTIYGGANLVNDQRRSFLIFVNDQSGNLFYIHLFTGQYGGVLTANWIIDNYSETLTPIINGNDIVINCSGTRLHSAWGNGFAITN